MGLGEVIREARVRAGLSQEALGRRLDVSDVAVSLWETGKTTPSGANMLRLIDLLGIDPVHCLGDGERYSPKDILYEAPIYASISAGRPRGSGGG